MAGKRKERVAAFNRANILESAHELFRQKGIEGTTMDDIASHAEYSKTTIYNYFGSKEGLICYLIFEGLEFLQARLLEDAEHSRSFADFYRRFCTSTLELHEKYPLYYDGIAGTLPLGAEAPSSDIRRKIYITGEAINEIIEEQILKGMAEGSIRPDSDPASTVIFMRLCLMGLVEKAALKEDYISYRLGKTKEEFLELSFRKLYGLFAGLESAVEPL